MEPEKKKSRVSILTRNKSMISKSTANISRSLSRMKVRRPSFGFSGVPGIRNAERTSQLTIEFKRPIQTYLNTYQLDPHVRFNRIQVKKATEEILDEYFTDYKYNADESPSLALQLSAIVMRVVKAMNFNRYRILAIVTIGQMRAQSYINAIAFLWDHERDGYMNIQREVHTAFIQVTVFGIYLD